MHDAWSHHIIFGTVSNTLVVQLSVEVLLAFPTWAIQIPFEGIMIWAAVECATITADGSVIQADKYLHRIHQHCKHQHQQSIHLHQHQHQHQHQHRQYDNGDISFLL